MECPIFTSMELFTAPELLVSNWNPERNQIFLELKCEKECVRDLCWPNGKWAK